MVSSNAVVSAETGAMLGEPFKLRVGRVAEVEGEGLRVGLRGVSSDSRRPEDAIAEVWITSPPGERVERRLHTDQAAGDSTSYLSYELKLVALEPRRRTLRPIAPEDYVATLVVIELGAPPPAGARAAHSNRRAALGLQARALGRPGLTVQAACRAGSTERRGGGRGWRSRGRS